MDTKTLTALKGSILKWEKIVEGTEECFGSSNCPLCFLFNNDSARYEGVCCLGCPVAATTGKQFCRDTPFYHHQRYPTIGNAQAELDFLRSLLPTESSIPASAESAT